MNLNKVALAGNLTRDPELRYTPKGTAVAKVGVAVNRRWTTEGGEKKEEVTFVDVTFFGNTAEAVGQWLKKGNPIYLEGRLKLDLWDDKETGQKRQKLHVIAESFQFVGRKTSESSGEDEGAGRREKPQAGQAAAEEPQADGPGTDDDVPF